MIVSGPVPVLVTVKVCDLVCPSTTLPKLKLLGDIERPGCAPVPVTAIFNGEFVALLTTVIDPVTLPAVVGANATFNVAFSAGFRVPGISIPLAVRPVPATVTDEILTAEFPAFVNTIGWPALVPVAIAPKLILLLFAFN